MAGMASAFRGETVEPMSVIVRVLLPSMAAALCTSLAACTPAEEPAPTLTPASSTPTVEPSPTPSVSYPGHIGDPPEPPKSFGKWKHDSGSLANAQIEYASPDGGLTVAYASNTSSSKMWVDQSPHVIRHWLCDTNIAGVSSCHTDAWNGAVGLYLLHTTEAELAAIGDELMKAWK